jgi:predicted RNA-binding Zn-ribbon protein involved in translation (DUF1610 family)
MANAYSICLDCGQHIKHKEVFECPACDSSNLITEHETIPETINEGDYNEDE